MSPGVALLWSLNIVLDTTGQLAFKAAASRSDGPDARTHWRGMLVRPWIWLGSACYVVEFVVWIAFLSLVPLGRGVLLGSINIVAVMVAGRFLFGERLTPVRVCGIALVTLGVALVGTAG